MSWKNSTSIKLMCVLGFALALCSFALPGFISYPSLIISRKIKSSEFIYSSVYWNFLNGMTSFISTFTMLIFLICLFVFTFLLIKNFL
jgi:hypothetical protein